MKNKLSLFLLIFGLGLQAQAQLSLGIKGGYTRAWEDYGDVALPPNAPIEINGANVTLMSWYRFNRRLSVGIEPGYVRRGAACIPGFVIWNGDTRFLLDYVEMPVMIRFDILSLAKQRFQLYSKLGAGASMIVRAQQEVVRFDDPEATTRTPIDLGENSILNRWDTGGYAAVGTSLKLGQNQLLLEGNYYYGLIDASRNLESQNRSFNVNLGFMHNF